MQISAAIIEKLIFHHISANIAHNSRNKVSMPMFSGTTIIKGPFLNELHVFLTCYANYKVSPCLNKFVLSYRLRLPAANRTPDNWRQRQRRVQLLRRPRPSALRGPQYLCRDLYPVRRSVRTHNMYCAKTHFLILVQL